MKKTVQSDIPVRSVPVATVRPFRFVSFKKTATSEHERMIATFMLIPIIIILLVGTARIDRIKTVSAQTATLPEITVTMPVYPGEPIVEPIKTIGGGFKAYERVDKITRKDSKQYALKQLYWVDSDGFCRFNEMYVVAMGSKYGQRIGQMFTIEMESRTIKAVLGDVKRDSDVIDGKCKTNGSIIEFIVSDMDGDRLQEIMQGEIIRIEEEK
jgi:hypothetical protein